MWKINDAGTEVIVRLDPVHIVSQTPSQQLYSAIVLISLRMQAWHGQSLSMFDGWQPK
jgi:hypothetical protein